MKQFWRKIPGKVTLFIIHLLCVMFLLGTVIAAYLMGEAGVYTETKTEVFNTMSKQLMGEDILKMLEKYNRTTDTPLQVSDCGNLRFYLYDATEMVVAESKEEPNPDKDLAGTTLYYYYETYFSDEAPAEDVPAEESYVESEAAESSVAWESETVESETVESENVESEVAESSVVEEREPEAAASSTEPAWDETVPDNSYQRLVYGGEGFLPRYGDGAEVPYYAECWLKNGLPENDKYATLQTLLNIAYTMRYSIYILALLCLIGAIASFAALMCVAGRHPEDDGLYPGVLYKVPADLLVILLAGASCIPMALGLDMMDSVGSTAGYLVSLGIAVAGALLLYISGVGCCMSIAVRLKTHTLLKNTLCYNCLRLCWHAVKWCCKLCRKTVRECGELLGKIPAFPQAIMVYLGITILELLLWIMRLYPLFWIVAHLAVIPAFLYVASMVHTLRLAARRMAEGDLTGHVDTSHMRSICKEHGDDLNHIADGMAIAVEERLKSERMKTELITNVSHDIKTPLTSIINYASLISAEPCENERITEYAKVLVRQSDRLKRLIEDLVEASKASTGNLEVHPAPCDAGVFIEQAAGEYEEKLEKAGLTLVTSKPEQEVRIMADGRRMWRVFDNLMNNICKYAQSGTRVYLMLELLDGQAVFSFKNISREPLNVSAEELMERFVRGDASRNTEGNGLGLSIARSMTELQGGTLTLSVDGDLFKAILCFPILPADELQVPGVVLKS